MKKAIFLAAIVIILSKMASAEAIGFNYSGIAMVDAGSAMGSYTTTPEPGWTWSAGWGVVNPYTHASVLNGVVDPPPGSLGNADAFNWSGVNPLTISFSTPQNFVRVETAILDDLSTAAYIELIAYNAGGTQIDSKTQLLDGWVTIGISESTFDISEVALLGLDSNGQMTAYRDLFAIAAIDTPEPGTISMLTSGLLGLAVMLKLRRRSARVP